MKATNEYAISNRIEDAIKELEQSDAILEVLVISDIEELDPRQLQLLHLTMIGKINKAKRYLEKMQDDVFEMGQFYFDRHQRKL